MRSISHTDQANNNQVAGSCSSLTFGISNAHEIFEKQQARLVSNNGWFNNIVVTIPEYRIATLLFQSYESNVDHLCHILHLPTMQSLMKTFYLRINQNRPVSPGQAALLVSIFAIGAYFHQPSPHSEVATSSQDANHLYKILSRGALDILDHSRRTTSGILEDVQASILMSFVAYHLDGFAAGGRLLLTTAAALARGLRLHRLDADTESAAENEASGRLLIEREVKRRVFWHIATTDWCLTSLLPSSSQFLHLSGYYQPFPAPKKAPTSSIQTILTSDTRKIAMTTISS